MQRIMIIGSPGSGKSTLAGALGDRLNLPVVFMDKEVHWMPGWQERSGDEKARIVAEIIARDAWVFEGGHSRSYAARVARADLLIWLDLPVWLRLWRVFRRTLRDLGTTRPDMQDDCPERLDMLPGFVGFILRTRVTSRRRQRAVFDAAQCPKHHLKTPRAVDRLLKTL